jgi:hypothetical protein
MAEAEAIHKNDPEQSEEDAFNEVCGDQFYWEREWSDLLLNLTSTMRSINPGGLWRVEGRSMGWQKRDGYKDVDAQEGGDLLRAVLPKGESSFKIYLVVDLLMINCSHHDSPVGAEWYYIRRRRDG